MDVFDLVAKISLDSSGFESGLSKAKDRVSSFGDVFKANIASDLVKKGFDGIVSGTKAAVGGLTNLVKESTNAFGAYQQNIGGIQKLYGNMSKSPEEYAASVGKSVDKIQKEYNRNKEAEEEVLGYAKTAYKEAGMSANKYMETATQFSASLISSLGGDTKKAADQTQVAMVAISDNVNTFGSNMEDVTNAFKGFSKQNYTMLDNLKLGYGGTKEEMERLISDANEWGKANGKASDLSIDSFSDVVTAIEQIQEKQHIAGTTAREAATTLQGSMEMAKNAWENLKTSIGSGDDLETNVNNLVDSLVGHAATAEDVTNETAKKVGDHVNGFLDNLLPTVETALKGLGNLIEKAAPIISDKLPALIEAIVPSMLSAVNTLASTIITNLPGIINSIGDALSTSLGGIVDPSKLASKVTELISGLGDAVASVLPDVINVGTQIITAIIQGITDNADTLLNGAMQIIEALGNGIITNLPLLVDAAVQLLQSFTQYLTEHKEEIQGGIKSLVDAIVQGIITLTPDLADAALAIVTTLGGALIQAVPDIVEQLPTFIGELFGAVTDAISTSSPSEQVALAGVLLPIFTGGIKDAISGVSTAKDIVGKGADIFSKIFGKGKSSSKGDNDFSQLEELSKYLPDTEKISGLDKLKTALSGVKDGLAGIGGKALDGLKNLGGLLTGTVGPAIVGFLPTLVSLLPVILGIAAAVTAVILVVKNWDKISKALQKGWEKLKDIAGTVWNGITDTVTGAWDGIKTGVSKGAEKVKNLVGGAWDKIKKSTSDKWNNIKATVEKNGGGIKGVIKTAAEGYLAPWKKGFEAINKATGGKLGETLKLVKEKAKDILNGIKEKFKGAADIGGNLVKGLWKGIDDKVSWIIEKVKGFGKKVLKGLKDFFKIKSPSRVMRDEVGANIALGVIKGIQDKEKSAVKVAEEFADRVYKATTKIAAKPSAMSEQFVMQGSAAGGDYDAAVKQSSFLKKQYNLSDQEQASYWVSFARRAGKGTEAYAQAMKKVSDIQSKYNVQAVQDAETALNDTKQYHDISTDYEVKYWNKIRKQYNKGTHERYLADKKYTEAKKQLDSERLQSAQDELEKYETYHTMSLADEVRYWDDMRKQFEKGTDARYQADKEYLTKKKSLQEQEKSANESLKSALKTAEQNYQSAIQASIDKISDRKDSLLGTFSLFEKYDMGDKVTKSTLTENLMTQVDAMEEYQKESDKLKSRLGNSKLFQSIRDMGISGLQDMRALNSMTDEELDYYKELYNRRNTMAGDQAKKDTQEEVQKANTKALKTYVEEASSAWKTYVTAMDEAGVKVTGLTKSVKNSFKNIGEDYTKVLKKMGLDSDEQMTSISDTMEKGFKKLTGGTKKYGRDLVQNFIDGIKSKDKDLTDTLDKHFTKKIKKRIGFSEPEEGPLADFHTYAPDMIDLFTKGITDNGHKIGEALDKSIALSDLSSRITDGLFTPAVQAAGNSLQIAGLPDLTEIAGQASGTSQSQPTNLNITMQVDKTAFARIIYQLNKSETQRVGVNLAYGTV